MFIEINGVILDKKEQGRKVLLLKRLLHYEFSEAAKKYGFSRKGTFFIHDETKLKAKLVFEEEEGKPL